MVVSQRADQTLHNFCHWQSNIEGLHHDHAILLTGVDICAYNGKYCDTLGTLTLKNIYSGTSALKSSYSGDFFGNFSCILGFAPIEGMCKRFHSCTINEDNGLGTAFTITHETGHKRQFAM